MIHVLSNYLPYLLLTLAIEAPLAFTLFVRRSGWPRALLVSFLASLVSHPLLFFVWTRVVSMYQHYWLYVGSGEALVVLIEAGIFFAFALPSRAPDRLPRATEPRKEHLPRVRDQDDGTGSRFRWAILVSLLVNFVSWGTGMSLYYAGWLGPYVRATSGMLRALLSGVG